jgi:hypothetical protein
LPAVSTHRAFYPIAAVANPGEESDSDQQPRSLEMESITKREAWNKEKLVGQKPALKPKDI